MWRPCFVFCCMFMVCVDTRDHFNDADIIRRLVTLEEKQRSSFQSGKELRFKLDNLETKFNRQTIENNELRNLVGQEIKKSDSLRSLLDQEITQTYSLQIKLDQEINRTYHIQSKLHEETKRTDELKLELDKETKRTHEVKLELDKETKRLDELKAKLDKEFERTDEELKSKLDKEIKRTDELHNQISQGRQRTRDVEERVTMLASSLDAWVASDRLSLHKVIEKQHPTEVSKQDLENQRRCNTDIRRQAEGGPAFTVYLSKDVVLGASQPIPFDRIITNEASGYNVHTNAFTCSKAGVYLLAFFVGDNYYDNTDFLVYLEINSVNQVDAALQPMHTNQELQGGNLIIARLSVGDVVMVKTNVNAHAEGSTDLRTTTFSGVFLHS